MVFAVQMISMTDVSSFPIEPRLSAHLAPDLHTTSLLLSLLLHPFYTYSSLFSPSVSSSNPSPCGILFELPRPFPLLIKSARCPSLPDGSRCVPLIFSALSRPNLGSLLLHPPVSANNTASRWLASPFNSPQFPFSVSSVALCPCFPPFLSSRRSLSPSSRLHLLVPTCPL